MPGVLKPVVPVRDRGTVASTTIPSISSANLGKLFVRLPSLDVPRRIGAEVAAADANIAAPHKQMQTAEVERTGSVIALFANPPASLCDGDEPAAGSEQST